MLQLSKIVVLYTYGLSNYPNSYPYLAGAARLVFFWFENFMPGLPGVFNYLQISN